LSRDEDGTELPDFYAAQSEAIRMSGEILRDMDTVGRLRHARQGKPQPTAWR
jgi:hypothetical protein